MPYSKLLNLCVLACVITGNSGTLYADPEGYYWREYTGSVPQDAITGGVENGVKTYLGQTLFDKIYVPAKIIADEGKAVFEWGGQSHSKAENIKILCTNHIERFFWRQTTSANFKNINDRHFVVAAREGTNSILYFARTKQESDNVVGKLLVNNDVVLHMVHKGKVVRTDSFEVLFYKPPNSTDVPSTPTVPTVVKCYCPKTISLNIFSC